jgi:pyrroline-5-carboxylate reductase
MKAISFLGGGRITGALCAGLRLASYNGTLLVYDRNPSKLRALERESRVEIARDVKSAIQRAEMVIVAVRPASVQEMLREVVVASAVSSKLCVSLAAGIPLRRLQTWLPGMRWARAMPSPVCRAGRGLTALCFDRNVKRSDRARVRELFARVGLVVEVPERRFDAFTATYSSSHGYHALTALAEAGRRAGLDRATSLTAAAHALADGIWYWRESGLNLDELLHEAATPGGIAAATMSAMDKAGYARVVAKGLAAGISQARRNAKR